MPLDVNDLDEKEIYEQASLLYKAGRYKEAERMFHLLTGMSPFAKVYWKALAASLQMQGLYEEALAAYTAAAHMDKEEKDPFCPAYAGECLYRLGEYEKALMALDHAIIIASRHLDNAPLVDRLKLLQDRWSQYVRNSSCAPQSNL